MGDSVKMFEEAKQGSGSTPTSKTVYLTTKTAGAVVMNCFEPAVS